MPVAAKGSLEDDEDEGNPFEFPVLTVGFNLFWLAGRRGLVVRVLGSGD